MSNLLDIFVIIIILGLAILGFRDGFLRGAVKLAGFIITIFFIALFPNRIINTVSLGGKIPPEISTPLIFIAIFIISSIAFHFLAEILYKLTMFKPLKVIDSGLGVIFGILKALFLSAILAMLLSFAPTGTFLHSQFETSYTGKPLQDFLYLTVPIIKSAMVSIYQKYIPVPEEQEKKKDEKIIPPNFI